MVPTTKEAERAELHKTIWRIANDLRKEWQEDDQKQSKAVVDAVAREFNFVREQLVEIRTNAKETRSELSGKIDRLTERVK